MWKCGEDDKGYARAVVQGYVALAENRPRGAGAFAAIVASSLLAGGTALASRRFGGSPGQGPATGHQGHQGSWRVDVLLPGPSDRWLGQGIVCYSPQQIQAAYGITPLLNKNITGKGRTIAIIDAFSNPYVGTYDLPAFDTTFGLPTPELQRHRAAGRAHLRHQQRRTWLVGLKKITLDVLWSHAAAPGANILLVEAKSDQGRGHL